MVVGVGAARRGVGKRHPRWGASVPVGTERDLHSCSTVQTFLVTYLVLKTCNELFPAEATPPLPRCQALQVRIIETRQGTLLPRLPSKQTFLFPLHDKFPLRVELRGSASALP